MKRILMSLVLITSAAGTLIYASTGAFFSDTESSLANVFTAGSIDLKIDHSLSTYNGDAVAQDLVVVSDTTSTYVEDDTFGAASGNAVNLSFVHPVWETIPGANWIWATQGPNHPADPTNNEAYIFTKTFNWNGPVTSAFIDFGADNYYDVSVNGSPVYSNHSLIVDNFQQNHHTDVTAFITQGVNTITFRGENQHVDGTDAQSNPAGVIFRLEVHGQALNPDPIDLSGQPFWTFDDVKPADQGRDVFSLHVDTNDAWSCMIVDNITNEENDRIEPETTAGDTTDGPSNGELGQFLHLFLWKDINGDGMFNPPTEAALTPLTGDSFTGPTLNIPVNDSTTIGGPLPGGTSENVGAAWCAGTMSVDGGTGVITCDGNTPNINQSQTDSTSADLTFYATQARNQPTFSCASVVLED
jgi:hypothetical protein